MNQELMQVRQAKAEAIREHRTLLVELGASASLLALYDRSMPSRKALVLEAASKMAPKHLQASIQETARKFGAFLQKCNAYELDNMVQA